MDPYAPITPEQEKAIVDHMAGLGRLTRERILKQCPELTLPHTLDAGRAAELLARLKGEPPAPFVPAVPADPAATRAFITQQREGLDAHFSIRRMQSHPLHKTSLFAGFNGQPHSTNR